MSKTYHHTHDEFNRRRNKEGRRSRQSSETLRRSNRRSKRLNDDFQFQENELRQLIGF